VLHTNRAKWLITALLVIGIGPTGVSQKSCLPERFRDSAIRALESPLCGVFVVNMQAMFQQRRSRVFYHAFTVDEVIKPYRSDGTFWVPLGANELTSDRKPTLLAGKRYLILTGLKYLLYGWLYVEDHFPLEKAGHDDRVIAELRELARKHAAYGSSRLLEYYFEQPLDVGGVTTRHADGHVDPEVFGLARETVRDAVGEGKRVLLARYINARGRRMGPRDYRFEIVEGLGSEGRPGERLWVHRSETYSEIVARSRQLPTPYKAPTLQRWRLYVILVENRDEGPPVLRALLPTINEDNRTVRMIRSWVKEKGDSNAKGGMKRRNEGEQR